MKKNLFALVFFTIGFLSFAQMFDGKIYRNEAEVKEALSNEFVLTKTTPEGKTYQLYKLNFGIDVTCFVNFSTDGVTFKLLYDISPGDFADIFVQHMIKYYGIPKTENTVIGLVMEFGENMTAISQDDNSLYIIIQYKE